MRSASCGDPDRGETSRPARASATWRVGAQLDVVVLSILLYALLGKLADSVIRLLERDAELSLQAHARS
jgi:hypothetical protein